MNRSFQSVVIAFFASILLISGCSSGSSTGVSFSRDAVTERQCFAEYVSFYDDLQVDFMEGLTDPLAPEVGVYDYDNFNNPSDPIAFDLTADYGKNHYYRTGAREGRQLPYGCERFLRPDPRCFDSYFKQDSNGDIWVGFFTSPSFLALQAISEMEEIHGVRADREPAASTFSGLPHMAVTGYEHWITHGREEGRPVPEVLFRSGTLEALNCQGMITHQPACRSGSRFPNCNDFDLRLATALAAAAAEAQACADRGGALNTDTNRCTIPQEEEEAEESGGGGGPEACAVLNESGTVAVGDSSPKHWVIAPVSLLQAGYKVTFTATSLGSSTSFSAVTQGFTDAGADIYNESNNLSGSPLSYTWTVPNNPAVTRDWQISIRDTDDNCDSWWMCDGFNWTVSCTKS